MDPSDGAEVMFRRMCSKLVGTDMLIAGEKPEVLGRDPEVEDSFFRTDRAVALYDAIDE
jgi:hypothetical protein